MSIYFGEIYLYSKNPAKLYHFLSFVFDIEADYQDALKVKFSFKDVDFVILKSSSLPESMGQNPFSLFVTDKKELFHFAQTVEFYYYKEGKNSFSLTRSHSHIAFTDPDGRKWKIKLPHCTAREKAFSKNNDFENRNLFGSVM